ncbi:MULTISPECIES: Imm49 family immunity protein [Halorussus]|uniref:Imm49 family immunity protein n=1 Tax=Halorussus TaxID=1070314 RepID=UPI0020A05065|nr:Imm49 family immunity protein [Halorussus vallis]USZ74939.1 immunity 49 family protein [Halorussus vallis]
MATKVASEGIERQSPEYYVHLDNCLANLILGRDDEAVEAADALTAMEPDAPKRVGSYPGLGDACRAIVDRDTNALDAALGQMLSRQDELAEQRVESLDHVLVCFPTIVFLLLARDRGIPVEELDAFESEYVPKTLFERRK